MNREHDTQQWYDTYYSKSGANRNDLRCNPGVLFQALALESSIVRAVRLIGHDPATAKVLDVGCGSGMGILSLLRLRYRPENVTGIDIRSDQVQSAAHFLPQARFVAGDASAMGFDDDTFDLVYESTMFATLPDDALSGAIAREMIRVCRPGGYLLLVDWWMPKIGDPEYKALTRGRLKSLFLNSNKVELLGIRRGAIVPPLGRLLSKWLPSLYFLTTAMVPLVVGQVTYVLRKN